MLPSLFVLCLLPVIHLRPGDWYSYRIDDELEAIGELYPTASFDLEVLGPDRVSFAPMSDNGKQLSYALPSDASVLDVLTCCFGPSKVSRVEGTLDDLTVRGTFEHSCPCLRTYSFELRITDGRIRSWMVRCPGYERIDGRLVGWGSRHRTVYGGRYRRMRRWH